MALKECFFWLGIVFHVAPNAEQSHFSNNESATALNCSTLLHLLRASLAFFAPSTAAQQCRRQLTGYPDVVRGPSMSRGRLGGRQTLASLKVRRQTDGIELKPLCGGAMKCPALLGLSILLFSSVPAVARRYPAVGVPGQST